MNELFFSSTTARRRARWSAPSAAFGAMILPCAVAHAEDAAPRPTTAATTTKVAESAPTAPPTVGAPPTSGTPAPTPPASAEPVPAAPSPAAPAPDAPAPAPAAPAPAALAPPPAAPAPTTTYVATSPGEALVHVGVNYRDAWLETRSYVDGGEFKRTCAAPCDIKLTVDGLEARVVAPGMTPSNVFRFDGGGGVAGVRVDGGSASARRAGIITLAVGIPVALVGMGLFAMGRVERSSGLEAAGITGLAAGGVTLAFSLPLLLIGSTHVKNAKGSQIAGIEPRWLNF